MLHKVLNASHVFKIFFFNSSILFRDLPTFNHWKDEQTYAHYFAGLCEYN